MSIFGCHGLTRRSSRGTGLVGVVLPVKKKNILLTIWLLLPITIVSLLMVWIFYSLNTERLMDDAVPYGAGAGDTGNANAIGEWLAGHDADEISLAVKARREGLAIDPRDWPGGMEVRVVGLPAQTDVPPYFAIYHHSGNQDMLRATLDSNSAISPRISYAADDRVQEIYFLLGPDGVQTNFDHDAQGIPSSVTTNDGQPLKPLDLEPRIPDPDLQTTAPMVIEVRLAGG